jgi:hypothetical protein
MIGPFLLKRPALWLTDTFSTRRSTALLPPGPPATTEPRARNCRPHNPDAGDACAASSSLQASILFWLLGARSGMVLWRATTCVCISTVRRNRGQIATTVSSIVFGANADEGAHSDSWWSATRPNCPAPGTPGTVDPARRLTLTGGWAAGVAAKQSLA